MLKHTVVIWKNALRTYHSKPDRDFNSILSNMSPCLSFVSEKVNLNADVKCEEVCVCCHQVLRWVSNYIRHTKQHWNTGKTKVTYINQMCDELHNQAVNELAAVESEHFSHVEKKSKKRACEVKDVQSRISEVQSVKLYRVDIMNELNFQSVNDIDPLQMSFLNLH